jgi:hypothetical protein
VLAAAAIWWPLFERGGFEPHGQAIFIAFSGAALAVAAIVAQATVAAMARTAPVLCLAGLAALGGASAAWTLIAPNQTLRLAMVVGGLAALAIVGGCVSRRFGAGAVAAITAATAVVSGLLGLWAAAHRLLPESEWLDGAWRPGGPFEYPNTLALLQVCALIPLGRGLLSRHLVLRFAAGGGLAVASAVIALAGSQAGVIAAGAVLAVAVAWPKRALGCSRDSAIALCICVLLAAAASYLIAGEETHRLETAGVTHRLIGLGVTTLAIAAIAPVAVRLAPSMRGRRITVAACVLVLGLLLALGAGSGLPGGAASGRGTLLQVGVETALDHPLFGDGAGSFPIASSVHQPEPDVRTIYAHDLPLEMWAELGLLGLAITAGLYLSVALTAWSSAHAPDALLLAPCVLAFLLANLIDWSWHQPAMAAVWALCLGGLIDVAQRQPGHRI